MIYVGCSGFQYADWRGRFYPENLQQKEYLGYYTNFFNTVEIDSSYYSFPGKKTVQAWIERLKDRKDFRMSLKFPKEVSHDPEGITERSIQSAGEFVSEVIFPLRDNGIMGAGLIQLSPFLNPVKDGGVIDSLMRLLDGLPTSEFNLAIEIRNSAFLVDRIFHDLTSGLKMRKVAICSVDSPGLPPFYESTSSFSYLRFHGQNRDLWFGSGELNGRLNKYDYLYEEQELIPWVERVKEMTQDIYIYFNNHAQAKAPKNATQFSKLLGLSRDNSDKQKSLTEF